MSSAFDEVVVSFAKDAAAKDVPRLDTARIPTSARRLVVNYRGGMHIF